MTSSSSDFKDQGNILFKEGRFDRAEELYSRAIEQDPSNAALYRCQHRPANSRPGTCADHRFLLRQQPQRCQVEAGTMAGCCDGCRCVHPPQARLGKGVLQEGHGEGGVRRRGGGASLASCIALNCLVGGALIARGIVHEAPGVVACLRHLLSFSMPRLVQGFQRGRSPSRDQAISMLIAARKTEHWQAGRHASPPVMTAMRMLPVARRCPCQPT
jgi:tetratricopeptide (TPR) repeat protein